MTPYPLWLAVGKSSFFRNVVVEIRPGFRNIQMSPIMVNLSEIFLVRMLYRLYRNTDYQASELNSRLVYSFKNMGWSSMFFIDMGQGSCFLLNVAKHRVIE